MMVAVESQHGKQHARAPLPIMPWTQCQGGGMRTAGRGSTCHGASRCTPAAPMADLSLAPHTATSRGGNSPAHLPLLRWVVDAATRQVPAWADNHSTSKTRA